MVSGGSSDLAAASGGVPADRAAAVLRAFRDSQASAQREEVRQIALAATFASFHEVDELTAAASSVDQSGCGGERSLLLGGDGSPWVAEFCVVEFAAATGRTTASARAFLGTSLALVHRLPVTWARVRAGGVDGWRARRVAEATLMLSAPAAAWVDRQVAHRVQVVGVRTLDRLVAEAVARFDPDQLVVDEDDDLARRRVEVQPTLSGRAVVTDVVMCLDLPDALDLDRVLDEIADRILEDEGPTDSREVRRARAVGMLARGEAVGLGRPVDMQIRVAEGDTVATVHSLGGRSLGMVSVARIPAWCDSATVTVTPVIDLTEEAVSAGRYARARVAHQVRLTRPTCAFPYCQHPAETCDLDHIEPWDPAGPADQTRTSNLAPLCRLHHRVKTHTAWRYHQGLPGIYYWESPSGDTYVVDREGTAMDASRSPRRPRAA